MRNLIIIVLFLSSCSSEIKDNELLGKWICTYGSEIDLRTEVIEPIEMQDTSEFVAEVPVDTSYFAKLIVFEFQPNGKLIYLNYRKSEGTWTKKSGKLFITIDSIEFTGSLANEILKIELNDTISKLELFFKKQDLAKAIDFKESDLIGTYWKYSNKDSIVATYHFLDSNGVVISDLYGTHFGKWDYSYYDGIGCLNTMNMHLIIPRLFYIIDEKGNLLLTDKLAYFEPPVQQTGKMNKIPLPSDGAIDKLKTRIVGTWTSKEFNTRTRVNKDSSSFGNLFLEITFNEDYLSIKYSGIRNGSHKEYLTEYIGNWHISETGEYIHLKYKQKNRNQDFATENIMPIELINSDSAILGLNYIFLGDFEYGIRDDNIRFIKNNGL